MSMLEVLDNAHQTFGRLRPRLSPVLSKAHDIHFMSLTERTDTSSAAGELVFHVFSAISHFEQRLFEAGMTPGRAARQLGISRSTALEAVRPTCPCRKVLPKGTRSVEVP